MVIYIYNLNIKPCPKLKISFYYSSVFGKHWIKTAKILEGIIGWKNRVIYKPIWAWSYIQIYITSCKREMNATIFYVFNHVDTWFFNISIELQRFVQHTTMGKIKYLGCKNTVFSFQLMTHWLSFRERKNILTNKEFILNCIISVPLLNT